MGAEIAMCKVGLHFGVWWQFYSTITETTNFSCRWQWEWSRGLL